MRKWNLVIFLSLLSASLVALPVRNPAEPELLRCGVLPNCETERCGCWYDALSLRLGMDADYVFNHHLQVDQLGSDRKIDHAHSFTNAAYLACNVCDCFDIYGTLGASRYYFSGNPQDFSTDPSYTNGGRIEIETNTSFSWSIGLRAVLWDWNCFTLGAEGEYFYTRPTVNSITVFADDIDNPSDLHMRYEEWQVGVGLAYRIHPIVVPYLAVDWSSARADFGRYNTHFQSHASATLNTFESARNVGYAAGLSFDLYDSCLFTIEWRFQNQNAVYVNGQVRF